MTPASAAPSASDPMQQTPPEPPELELSEAFLDAFLGRAPPASAAAAATAPRARPGDAEDGDGDELAALATAALAAAATSVAAVPSLTRRVDDGTYHSSDEDDPSLGPGDRVALRARRTCAHCRQAGAAAFTCPTCGAPYDSLACFRAHNGGRCRTRFDLEREEALLKGKRAGREEAASAAAAMARLKLRDEEGGGRAGEEGEGEWEEEEGSSYDEEDEDEMEEEADERGLGGTAGWRRVGIPLRGKGGGGDGAPDSDDESSSSGDDGDDGDEAAGAAAAAGPSAPSLPPRRRLRPQPSPPPRLPLHVAIGSDATILWRLSRASGAVLAGVAESISAAAAAAGSASAGGGTAHVPRQAALSMMRAYGDCLYGRLPEGVKGAAVAELTRGGGAAGGGLMAAAAERAAEAAGAAARRDCPPAVARRAYEAAQGDFMARAKADGYSEEMAHAVIRHVPFRHGVDALLLLSEEAAGGGGGGGGGSGDGDGDGDDDDGLLPLLDEDEDEDEEADDDLDGGVAAARMIARTLLTVPAAEAVEYLLATADIEGGGWPPERWDALLPPARVAAAPSPPPPPPPAQPAAPGLPYFAAQLLAVYCMLARRALRSADDGAGGGGGGGGGGARARWWQGGSGDANAISAAVLQNAGELVAFSPVLLHAARVVSRRREDGVGRPGDDDPGEAAAAAAAAAERYPRDAAGALSDLFGGGAGGGFGASGFEVRISELESVCTAVSDAARLVRAGGREAAARALSDARDLLAAGARVASAKLAASEEPGLADAAAVAPDAFLLHVQCSPILVRAATQALAWADAAAAAPAGLAAVPGAEPDAWWRALPDELEAARPVAAARAVEAIQEQWRRNKARGARAGRAE
jgi:hypothetical protein